MNRYNLPEENRLNREGFNLICGIDEVGLGPWAGPLAFGAVILPVKLLDFPFKDSKLLTGKSRENIFNKTKNKVKAFSVAYASNQEIDNLGLTKAKLLAFQRVIDSLLVKPDFLLIDGKSFFNKGNIINIPCKFVIDGDDKIKSISAASIFAKVCRDRLMINFHRKYPQYGFNNNKGYGTKEHQEALKEYGICPIHRKSYKPIKEIICG